MQQAAQCLTDLIKLASQTPGNYILDQVNLREKKRERNRKGILGILKSFLFPCFCSSVQHPVLCTSVQAAAVWWFQEEGGGRFSVG